MGVRRFSIAAAMALALIAAAPAQADEPDPQTVALGRELVTTYCADCHAIETTGDSTHPQAPPFRELHNRYELDWLSEGLVEGLVSGHPDMPEFEFDPAQAEAIIVSLESLSN